MFSTTVPGTVWKGTGNFVGPCDAVLITVGGVCADLCAAKSVVVDSLAPVISLKATVEECDCEEGYQLVISSTGPTPECGSETECCGLDDCSGFESVSVEIYGGYPWEDCCDPADCLDLLGSSDSCATDAKTECIGQTIVVVDGEVTYTDFFDGTYYVVAEVKDKVGNINTYYGEVTATDEDHVSFMELVVDPTTCEPCPAEASADVDDVIGECLAPATECWEEEIPELGCPEVVLDPAVPKVGEVVDITLTFNRAPFADEDVRAFVGPAIKTLPLGIPETAAALVIHQDATDGAIFTATYAFGTAGEDYIYVTVGCEDCTPCVTAVTVLAIEACPEFAWTGAVDALGDGEDWLKGGDTYTFTLTYDHIITDQELYQVRIRDYMNLAKLGDIFDDLRTLADMTTTDNMVFTGTFTPPALAGKDADKEYCTPAYVEVDILEECCEPCMYKFNVDATLPRAEIDITAVDCCGLAYLEFDSTPIDCDDTCCGDSCTSLTSWTIDIFDTEPIWDCCVLQTTPICEHEGTECPIDVNKPDACATCCLDTGDYWIITTLTDIVGNVNAYYGEVTLTGSVGDWTLVGTKYHYLSTWECDPATYGDDSSPFIDGSHDVMGNGDKVVTTSNTEQYGSACPW